MSKGMGAYTVLGGLRIQELVHLMIYTPTLPLHLVLWLSWMLNLQTSAHAQGTIFEYAIPLMTTREVKPAASSQPLQLIWRQSYPSSHLIKRPGSHSQSSSIPPIDRLFY